MATIAESLARFIADLRFDDLPPEVVDKAKMAILDTFGVALTGSQTPESRAIAKAVAKFDEGTRATVWGHGAKASVPMAALVNGTSAHARELDDWGAGLHSGAVVVPTVMAAAEWAHLSGKDLVTAVVAGYEVMIRAARAAGGDSQMHRGWHPTGSCGSFGAAAAAGKALNLDWQHMTWALGLAGSFTGGTLAFLADGAMSKRFHPGKAAETGLTAVFAAQEGFTGPSQIFEAERGGFLTTYGVGLANNAQILDGIGTKFQIMATGLKPYASCRDVHASIDAALELLKGGHLQAEEIGNIIVEGTEEARMLCAKAEVSTVLDAQMSIPYGVAVALLTGDAGLSQYSPPILTDPRVADLARKVRVVDSPKFQGAEHCAEVTVQMKGGAQYARRVDVPKGDPHNPMSPTEVRAKFEGLAACVLSRDQVERLAQRVESVEQVEEVRELCALLQGDCSLASPPGSR